MITYKKMEDIEEISQMATDLFIAAYQETLERDHMEYMLDMFFNKNNVIKNITDGYNYEYIIRDNVICGYIAYIFHEDYLYLSKLYLKPEYKGQNIASDVIEYLTQFNLPIRLNVNRYNYHAKHVYEKNGFKPIKELVTDIGSGFVMDDFIMEKEVNKTI